MLLYTNLRIHYQKLQQELDWYIRIQENESSIKNSFEVNVYNFVEDIGKFQEKLDLLSNQVSEKIFLKNALLSF